MRKAALVAMLILVSVSTYQIGIHHFLAQAQETRRPRLGWPKVEAEAPIHNASSGNPTMSAVRIVDDHIWATDAISADGLDHFDLPGHTAVPVDAATYHGYGKPNWTGNFSLTYPIESMNRINVVYLPFTPDNHTVTLTEGVDYVVHTYAIELLTSLDVCIINEHWVDGVNNSLSGWLTIGHVATGIQSVYVKFPNGTERYAPNYGFAAPPPSEWWFDPDWPWELERWVCFWDWPWPQGSEWWVNYTAASYLTVDYNAIAPPTIDATLDISPTGLNLQSKGKWVVGHIELPEGYNLGDIDVSTIMVNDTVPIDLTAPVEVGDYDNDSVSDLTFAFNRTEIVEYVVSRGVTRGSVTLALTGKLRRIVSFRGCDTIQVSRLVGDVNCDSTVDLYDVAMMLSMYGCREGQSGWNPNGDIAPPHGVIGIYDLVTCVCHYGETDS